MSRFEQIHADRLLKLADFLDTKVREENFNMQTYVSSLEFTTHTENGRAALKRVLGKQLPHCGTIACALGYCPIVFPDEWDYSPFGQVRLINRVPDGNCAEHFFDLEPEDDDEEDSEWGYLFAMVHNRTAKEEAQVIRGFVARKLAELGA